MKKQYIKPEMERIQVELPPLLTLSDPDHAESRKEIDAWEEMDSETDWLKQSASSNLQDKF